MKKRSHSAVPFAYRLIAIDAALKPLQLWRGSCQLVQSFWEIPAPSPLALPETAVISALCVRSDLKTSVNKASRREKRGRWRPF